MYQAVDPDPEIQVLGAEVLAGSRASLTATGRRSRKFGVLVALTTAALALIVVFVAPLASSSKRSSVFQLFEEQVYDQNSEALTAANVLDEANQTKTKIPGVPGKHALAKRPRGDSGAEVVETVPEDEPVVDEATAVEGADEGVKTVPEDDPVVDEATAVGEEPANEPVNDEGDEAKDDQSMDAESPVVQASPSPWKQYSDPASGNIFWYNEITKVSQWEAPTQEEESTADQATKKIEGETGATVSAAVEADEEAVAQEMDSTADVAVINEGEEETEVAAAEEDAEAAVVQAQTESVGYSNDSPHLWTGYQMKPGPNALAMLPDDIQTYFDPSAHLPDFELKSYEGQARLPEGYQKFSTNFFSHPKVIEAFENRKLAWVHDDDLDNPLNLLSNDEKRAYAVKHVKEQCYGSDTEDTIDVYINEKLMQQDMVNYEGYNVFNIDCRDSDAFPLIAFIVVMDRYGNLVAVHSPKIRAEAISMKDTNTVLFSLISGSGAWEWNWKTDEVVSLPFSPDAHTIAYDHENERYWGLRNAQHFDPSIAQAFDKDGKVVWELSLPGEGQRSSHINFLSLGYGGKAYFSLRSIAAIQSVDIEHQDLEAVIGGHYSHVPVVDRVGGVHHPLPFERKEEPIAVLQRKGWGWTGPWFRQHAGQHLSDALFSLFDNHVTDDKVHFEPDEYGHEEGNSALVVFHFDRATGVATEQYRFDTGDRAKIYGSASVLPSGNVLGNSYPDVVAPASADGQYHANLWEVTPEGELAWRVGFKGKNPFDAGDAAGRPHAHAVAPGEEPPVGWVVFNVERFYEQPSVAQPCATDEGAVRFLAFNTIRTQDDGQGVAFLYDMEAKATVANQVFSFQKSWLPRAVEMAVPEDARDAPLSLVVVNAWKDSAKHSIGAFSDLPQCSETHQNRIIN
mmetsp:Transcript_17263/g.26933  ORF Transcript_17263/g.26933 Transcript_17263/m.26933 type:complete len:908 (-) Transcript_17263:209-2932(-)